MASWFTWIWKSKAWRATKKDGGNMEWNTQTEVALREAIKTAKVPTSQKKVSILLLGSSQAGKSSFINSVLGALTDRLAPHVFAESGSQSVTRGVHSIDRMDGTEFNFKLVDTPGILESADGAKFIELLLQGQIKENCEIPLDFDLTNANFIVTNPDKMDAPCLVVVVLRAGKDITPRSALDNNLQLVKEAAGKNKLKVVIVLTRADLASQSERHPLKGNDVDYMFYSSAIETAVRKAEQQTRIPCSWIYPVTNYTEQQRTYTKMNVLHLFTFNELLQIAMDEANRRMLNN